MNRGLNPGGGRDFSLRQNAQTSSEVTQPYSQWVLVYSLAIKQPDHEVNHSLPSTAEDTNDWSYTSNSLYACMCEFLLRCFKTTLKTAVYVQMPKQLLAFRKSIVYIHYKNTMAWLGQIAAFFSLLRIRFN
jgi:hypothetical protein